MAVEVGAQAPKVTLIDTDKNQVTLPQPGEVAVLVFFPAAFTSVCTAELCTFRDAIAQFNDVNAKVYGISVDLPFSLGEFKAQQNLNFPLLSDHKHEAIEAYGVVLPDLAGLGITTAVRSVFVLGKDGKVAWEWISDNPGQQPDYEAVKQAVRQANQV
jgi:peroxiredoxin